MQAREIHGRPWAIGVAGGFSLLETLVALAILSVSALLIFQFVGQQFSLTARVERVASVSLSRAIDRERLAAVAAGIVPGWPETPEEIFTGTPAGFSGLTSGQLETIVPSLSLVAAEIVRAPVGQGAQLVYRSETASFVMAEFAQPAAFSYLAPNGLWVPDWPPPVIRDLGVFDETEFIVPRPLPLAIRIQVEGGGELDWVAPLAWRAPRLQRRQDLEIGIDPSTADVMYPNFQ